MQVLTVRTQGGRPSGPSEEKFILANSTFVSLNLNKWEDHACPVLYFVIEYKRQDRDNWITGMTIILTLTTG